jgi:hypothetical protein
VFTSTNETIDMRPFTLSPNPAVDFISIDGMNTKAGYMVFDGIGRCVVSGVAGINSSLIDIHTLTKGWYFLKIEGLEVKRFLKE